MVIRITWYSTLLGEGEARATFRSSCVWPWLMTLRFGRFSIDFRIFALIENWSYSKIDPNRCKSIQIDRNVSYDTLLDAASATMLIVSSENYKNLIFWNIFEYDHMTFHWNLWKSTEIDRNVSCHALQSKLDATVMLSMHMNITRQH